MMLGFVTGGWCRRPHRKGLRKDDEKGQIELPAGYGGRVERTQASFILGSRCSCLMLPAWDRAA
jgi:hypothetical protein